MKKNTLLSIAYERNFDRLDEAWIAALEPLPADSEDLLNVINWLMRVKERERAELFLAMLVEAFEEQRPGAGALAICEKALALFPDSAELRRAYASQFIAVHTDNPAVEGIITISKLTAGAPLQRAYDEITKRVSLLPGRYAVHRKRRYPLKIVQYTPADDSLLVHDGSHEFSTDLETFRCQYDLQPETDFRAMMVFEPQRLTDLARTDPVTLITRYLQMCGKTSTFRNFKDTIVPALIPAEEWKEWWHSAKSLLVHDLYIELGTGTQPALSLRETPQNFSEELIRTFDHVSQPYQKAALVLHYINEIQKDVPADQEVIDHFIAGLNEEIQRSGARAVVAWLALARAAAYFQTPLPPYQSEWLAAGDTPRDCVLWFGWEPLFIDPFLSLLPGVEADWLRYYSVMVPGAPVRMMDRMCAVLAEAGDTCLFEPIEKAVQEPDMETAEAYAWCWRSLAAGESLPFVFPHDLFTATITLFALINQLNSPHEHLHQNLRGTLSAVRQVVSSNRYAVIASVFNRLAPDYAAELYQAITSNPGISTAMRSHLIQMLANA